MLNNTLKMPSVKARLCESLQDDDSVGPTNKRQEIEKDLLIKWDLKLDKTKSHIIYDLLNKISGIDKSIQTESRLVTARIWREKEKGNNYLKSILLG